MAKRKPRPTHIYRERRLPNDRGLPESVRHWLAEPSWWPTPPWGTDGHEYTVGRIVWDDEPAPLSCGCPPEHHDEAVRRLADTMRRDEEDR